MQSLQTLLNTYSESHRNPVNKGLHWICIPLIIFSLLGLVMAIPFPFSGQKTLILNWSFILLLGSWYYYFRLSLMMFFGFLVTGILMLWGNFELLLLLGSEMRHVIVSLCIFVLAWIGQFIGHGIEGKRPSFLTDLQFLLIGPAWLMHFIFKKAGIPF